MTVLYKGEELWFIDHANKYAFDPFSEHIQEQEAITKSKVEIIDKKIKPMKTDTVVDDKTFKAFDIKLSL